MSYIILILLIVILVRQVIFLRSLEISTQKSTNEIICVVCGVLVLFGVTFLYAKIYVHYLIFAVAVAVFIVTWLKEGISKDGILAYSNGKQFYKYDQIKNAEIIINQETVKIIYYTKDEKNMVIHKFDKKYLYNIINSFKSRNLSFSYID